MYPLASVSWFPSEVRTTNTRFTVFRTTRARGPLPWVPAFWSTRACGLRPSARRLVSDSTDSHSGVCGSAWSRFSPWFPACCQSARALSGLSYSGGSASVPWLGAAIRSPVLRPGPKNSTAPWRSDCDRVDYARTDSRSSDRGVSEPVPLLSVPLVSVLWLEPTLRNPVFAYPAVRSPLLCWCSLSESGLSRWPGKPGDRLFGST